MFGHPLSAVFAFARVAHHASFTRAASELSVSPSALSQTVRALEAQLRVRLLHRTTRRVGLTEQGERFLERITPGLRLIDAAFQDLDLHRDRPAGHLRITLPRVAADMLVLPHLPSFIARYPQVHVELSVDATLVDLVASGYDAGIRLGEALARDMVALPIGPAQRMAIVASPAYFQRHPPPQRPQDLLAHRCILYRGSSGRLWAWEFTRDGRDFHVEVESTLIVNDPEVALRMVREGLGMTQAFDSTVADDVAVGRLVRVLEEWQQPFSGFHIYYPAREHLAPKLRVFVDHLRAVNTPA